MRRMRVGAVLVALGGAHLILSTPAGAATESQPPATTGSGLLLVWLGVAIVLGLSGALVAGRLRARRD